jgi:predicted RNase H-like HicB family nuclease
MKTETVTCPCCNQQFTGQGETQQEALDDADEQLQMHLESEDC